jgi:glutathione S-transferase
MGPPLPRVAGGHAGPEQDPEFLAINPLKYIPTIQDDAALSNTADAALVRDELAALI